MLQVVAFCCLREEFRDGVFRRRVVHECELGVLYHHHGSGVCAFERIISAVFDCLADESHCVLEIVIDCIIGRGVGIFEPVQVHGAAIFASFQFEAAVGIAQNHEFIVTFRSLVKIGARGREIVHYVVVRVESENRALVAYDVIKAYGDFPASELVVGPNFNCLVIVKFEPVVKAANVNVFMVWIILQNPTIG